MLPRDWTDVRAAVALLMANVRYWRTVAPAVRIQLARWRVRAEAIPDPVLRELALAKLDGESFNAEAGAMLATLAPAARRGDVVEVIVALQVLFDLLDGLTERSSVDPLGDGERLFVVFIDAVRAPDRSDAVHTPDRRSASPDGRDGGYLWELSSAASHALARLPGAAAVSQAATASAERAAEAQIRMHAASVLGIGQLRGWGEAQAHRTGLGWRELAAGAASSVLVLHALTAAAADARTTPAQAADIEGTYLLICVLLTLLDSLTDHERDTDAGEPGYISLYEDRQLLAKALTATADRAARQVRKLPHGAQHMMILTGVVAYYTSTSGARSELARPLVAGLHEALRPLISPTLAVMRAWRLVRALARPETRRRQPQGGL
jgi:tetraprenyl-beta-curcumene synthase